MSESASNVVYLAIALIDFVIAGWKCLALLRDRTPTLSLITVNFVASGLVFAMAAPAGYRMLGELTGVPSFATLPVYIGILSCFSLLHVLTMLWDPRLRQSPAVLRRQVTVWSAAYVAAPAAMVAAFCSADLSGPADPLKFNTDFADEPPIQVFLGIFLATLACATLSTYRQCRTLRPEGARFQRALRSFGTAMLFVFGYVVCSVPAIVLAASGNHALDTVGVLGSTFGSIGALITSYGLSGAAVGAWLRERRDIKALQPLWDLVVEGVDEELAFSVDSARSHRLAWNVGFNLHRRVIEILDGMRALRPWVSPLPAAAVRAAHTQETARGSADARRRSERELQAAATAAALRDAAQRLQAARREAALRGQAGPQPPAGPPVALPGEDTPASGERQRLLRVAQALTDPLVSTALRAVRTQRSAHEAAKTAAPAQTDEGAEADEGSPGAEEAEAAERAERSGRADRQ
ncbi:MAB_1171c family putative transporter [Streptomyces angustmyceticus]|uniref:MAB_1171c family putative transporter n=1 Tax=Streptomyces angustmyceticus TaxID=285578 RepID=UPI003450360B